MRTHQGRGLGRRPRHSATPVLGRLGRLPHHWASPVSRWNFSAARTRLAPLCALSRPATPPSPVSPTARAAGPSPGTRSGQVLQLAALGSYPQRSGDPVVRAFSHTPGRLCISNLTDSSTLFALGRLKINRRIFWGSLYFCDFFSSSAVAIKLATPFNLLLLIEIFQIATPSSVFLSTPSFRIPSISTTTS